MVSVEISELLMSQVLILTALRYVLIQFNFTS